MCARVNMSALRTEWWMQGAVRGGMRLLPGAGVSCTRKRIEAARAPAADKGLKWEAWRTAAAISNVVESNAQSLVDTLLTLVDGSDRGALLAQQERERVEGIIENLEQLCMPEPLQSPLIFGEWDVVYSSNATATGGYYRSAIGRTLLKTKQMMQIIKEPDFVSNKVSFAALGVVDGEVSLKGKLEALDNRWIEIMFDSPDLKVGPIQFQYGGITSVKIAIIYLDGRVRLGRGSRGSLFVFKRC